VSTEQKTSWFVARTRPVDRIEFSVMSAINQREHQAMVPVEERWIVLRGKRTKCKYPWFPFYVFVGVPSFADFQRLKFEVNDMAERKGKRPPILNAVGYGRNPATLTDEDIQFLRTLSVGSPTTVNLHKSFKPGSKVEITDGPFAGYTAVVDSVTRKRVKAMVRMFNSMAMVEIEQAGVRAA
jgi:transcription antitermination factor NusG